MSIGSRIRDLRVSNGLSQADLGRIAGVTDKAVSTWESDEKIPRMKAIERISTHFGVSKGYIIDGEEKEKAPTERQLSEGQRLLLDLYDQLPEDKQRMFIEMLRAVAKAL